MKVKIIDRYIEVINQEVPLWLKLMNGIILLPIIAWPLVCLFSIFLLTVPNILIGVGAFFLAIHYPWPLVESVNLSFNLYLKNKTLLAILVPISIASILITFLVHNWPQLA
ncbi:hypothetical protein [Flavobacterium ovatum]|uniref:hypothetical protein n=1 Tax=Flavobacterium ovatum TaxID=1928857 RepID=UPI00344F1989